MSVGKSQCPQFFDSRTSISTISVDFGSSAVFVGPSVSSSVTETGQGNLHGELISSSRVAVSSDIDVFSLRILLKLLFSGSRKTSFQIQEEHRSQVREEHRFQVSALVIWNDLGFLMLRMNLNQVSHYHSTGSNCLKVTCIIMERLRRTFKSDVFCALYALCICIHR